VADGKTVARPISAADLLCSRPSSRRFVAEIASHVDWADRANGPGDTRPARSMMLVLLLLAVSQLSQRMLLLATRQLIVSGCPGGIEKFPLPSMQTSPE
jgi:hypothetical protein